MDQRVVIGDFLTGRNIIDVPTLTRPWGNRRNSPERFSVSINLADPTVRKLGIRDAAVAGKTFMAILIGDNVMAYGPIDEPVYNKKKRTLEIAGNGYGEYLKGRNILPLAALTQPLIDPVTGEPNVLTNTVLTGLSLGTINKRLIQQMMTWPGSNFNIVFQPDEAGIDERTYLGSNLKSIYSAINENASVEGGPDWEFAPRLTADRMGIELEFRTGTNAQPRLRSTSVHEWDYTVPEPAIDDLTSKGDASNLTGLAWTTGGRSVGEALVAHRLNLGMIADGFPLYESVDADHGTTSEMSTLEAYSAEAIRIGSRPTEFWSFRVRTDQPPYPGQYRVGDLCKVKIRNDDYLPDGTYLREIVTIAGDENPRWITVTTSGVTNG